MDATASTLPLVIFGGQGEDDIDGGEGGDIIFGDRGHVLFLDVDSQSIPVVIGEGISDEALALLESQAVTVLGHGGPGDKTDGIVRPVSIAISVDQLIGGRDIITTGLGSDLIFGGIDNDSITANRNEDTGFFDDGDNIVFGDNGFIDYILLDGDHSDIDRIWSTAPNHGGSDDITTGEGDDIVIGGEDGEIVDGGFTGSISKDTVNGDKDTITAGNGDNLIFGDNGKILPQASLNIAGGVQSRNFFAIDTQVGDLGGDDVILSR
ncbi:MAG: hypothetical protein IIA44_15450 [Acidobacteria bacterium]|nr:hypothetical protein [Acidobacteriota bacterium]